MITGNHVIAKSLVNLQLDTCFGIVGIPVVQLGFYMQQYRIKFYAMRNQQQASYAAGYHSYLNKKPALCLCVSGPGHINALSGLANAWANCFPMILISGASDLNQQGKGAFQECQQVYPTIPFCKYAQKVTMTQRIPFFFKEAIKYSLSGRPGPVYLQFPGDILQGSVKQSEVFYPALSQIPVPISLPDNIRKCVELLKKAQKPLVIIGKGAAYGRAQVQIRQLIERTQIPFLPTPMGKGVVSDTDVRCVSAARSLALFNSDTILLLGARLNWILHFGEEPRYNKKVKFIQLQICQSQFNRNVESCCSIIGDIKENVKLINKQIGRWKFANITWLQQLHQKMKKNQEATLQRMNDTGSPLSYYSAYKVIKDKLPQKHYMVAQGANTMDIARTIFTHNQPRTKLDAATFGTMGIGLPALLAFKSLYPEEWVIGILGDSAFGFSAMQCQTLTRYNLGCTIFIINNNGIYSGVQNLPKERLQNSVTALNPQARYEKIGQAFGGEGYSASSVQELSDVCRCVFMESNRSMVIYVDSYKQQMCIQNRIHRKNHNNIVGFHEKIQIQNYDQQKNYDYQIHNSLKFQSF